MAQDAVRWSLPHMYRRISLVAAMFIISCTLMILYGYNDQLELMPNHIHYHLILGGVLQRNQTLKIVYNRVPKCGSSTTMGLIRTVSTINHFVYKSSYITRKPFIGLQEQQKLVQYVDKFKENFIFDRHVYFINFTQFNTTNPVYINLIRDPVDQMVSFYYYERKKHKNRFGKDGLIRSINDCLDNDFSDCTNYTRKGLPSMVSFVCGQDAFCDTRSEKALSQAKSNVINYYAVIGILEDYLSFLAVLECLFPKFFQKVSVVFNLKKIRNKVRHKEEITAANREKLKILLKHEYKFYDFAKQRCHDLTDKVLRNVTGHYECSL